MNYLKSSMNTQLMGTKPRLRKLEPVSLLDRAIIMVLPVFCLTTLMQNVPGLSLINRVLVIPVLVLMLISLMSVKLEKWIYLGILIFSAVSVTSASMTSWTSQVMVAAPRALFCLILISYFYSKSETLIDISRSKLHYFQLVLITWSLLVAASIPLSSSWVVEWGGASYFVSFTDSAFQLMPTAMIAMALNMLCCALGQKNGLTLLLSVVPLFSGLQGGSRTYFILIVILFLLLLSMMKLSRLEKNALLALATLVFLYALNSSGLMAKIVSSTSAETLLYANTDLLGGLTSGRSDFWTADIKAFYSLPFVYQLIGYGYSFPYDTNIAAIGLSIYAHNDFINIAMETGYIGLACYLLFMSKFFSKVRQLFSGTNWQFFSLFIVWFFNAFVDAFYPYTSAVISLPLAAMALCMLEQKPNG